jgi:transcriptional regulator with XRE-family HTH domain
MNQIGPKIQEIRLKLGMTQDEFAVRCNLVGLNVSRSTAGKIEARVRRITDDEVELLAKALRVSIEDLYE